MAVTTSPRLLLTRWSAGTDPFTRAQLDQDFADLDNLAAIDMQGTLAARPAPGVRGRYYFATDDGPGRLHRDTGAAWVLLNPASALGGGVANSAPGDVGIEGASTTAARSDHRHGREAFGAVTPTTTYGLAPSNGAAGTLSRSDHTHGTPTLTAAVPEGVTPDDAGAVGVAALPARADHRHPIATAVAGSSAPADVADEGAAATFARSDHRHGRESLVALRDALIPAGTVALHAGAAAPDGWLLCNGAAVSRGTYPTLFAALGGLASPWGVPGGAGGSTFNVPDLRGRAPIGAGAGAGLTNRALAAAGGLETVALTLAQSPLHSHTINEHHHGTGGNNRGHTHAMEAHAHWVGWGGQHSHIVGSGGHEVGFRTDAGANGLHPGGERMTFSDIDAAGNHEHGQTGGPGWFSGGQPGESQNHDHGNTGGASDRGTNGQGAGAAHENMPPFAAVNFIVKAH